MRVRRFAEKNTRMIKSAGATRKIERALDWCEGISGRGSLRRAFTALQDVLDRDYHHHDKTFHSSSDEESDM